MTRAERAAVRAAVDLAQRERLLPVTVRRCPVHGRLVAVDGDGALIGRCDCCMTEAAAAIAYIEGAAT